MSALAHLPSDFYDFEDRRVRRWVSGAVVLGMVELPILFWLWLAPHLQPQRFTNHQDQIAAALRGRGYMVSQVFIEQGWPDKINNQTYGANLTIYLIDDAIAQPVIGRVECRVKKRNCWYRVAKLGIEREGLSDLLTRPPTSSASSAKPAQTWWDQLHARLVRTGLLA